MIRFFLVVLLTHIIGLNKEPLALVLTETDDPLAALQRRLL